MSLVVMAVDGMVEAMGHAIDAHQLVFLKGLFVDTISAFEPLTVMLSSRCSDPVPFGDGMGSMADVRRPSRTSSRSSLFGMQVFKVWVHENEAVSPVTRRPGISALIAPSRPTSS
jgi:hypothetical protein